MPAQTAAVVLRFAFLGANPGAEVEDIRLAYRGAERLSVDQAGQLLIHTSLGILEDARPVSYQEVGGTHVPVESRFVLNPDARDATGYGFVDAMGQAYVTGETNSAGSNAFLTTFGAALDRTNNGADDVFVTTRSFSGISLAGRPIGPEGCRRMARPEARRNIARLSYAVRPRTAVQPFTSLNVHSIGRTFAQHRAGSWAHRYGCPWRSKVPLFVGDTRVNHELQ